MVKAVSAADDINKAMQEAVDKSDHATLAAEQTKAAVLMIALQQIGETSSKYGPLLPSNEVNPSPY